MDGKIIERFDEAQRRSIRMMSALMSTLEEGMSERDIANRAEARLSDFGFHGWFYPPEIQIGLRTKRAGIWRLPSSRISLRRGDPVMLALGPCGERVFGDIAATVVFRKADSELVSLSRQCVRATCGFASRLKCVGEVYVFARAWAANHRIELANHRSIGHALLPPQGRLALGFPRSTHAATWLRRYQVHFLNPLRMQGMYAIGPQLNNATSGARFREIVLIDGDQKRLLGRPSADEIGVF